MKNHFLAYLNEVIVKQWDAVALADYNEPEGSHYTFGEMARQMKRLCQLFDSMGLKKGDKIALAGRNCANWALTYLAVSAFKGVVVSILQDFVSSDICNLLHHSESKALFVGPFVWKDLQNEQLPDMEAVISLQDFSLLRGSKQAEKAVREWHATADEQLKDFSPADVDFSTDGLDDLSLLNYTSGSTGSPKGVMLTARSISSNVESGMTILPVTPGKKVVSMLPLAHMYGQVAELLYPLCSGSSIYFLTKSPTPSILLKALQDVQPYLVVTVPLVIEKIYKKHIAPVVTRKAMRIFWKTPIIGDIIRGEVRKNLKKTFGGNIQYFLCGGAAINPEVEKCLMDAHFPISVGYGMTECGPLIGGESVKKFKARSGGKPVLNMEVKIDEPNAEGVGEILVRGENVMLGYYKNEEATKAVFTEDGWLRTGDLGMLDKHNNIFIKGRNKTMILGASGQNIYPEDIENRLNNQAVVAESVVVERDGKLVALVFPDYKGDFDENPLKQKMDELLAYINEQLPSYSKLHHIELVKTEFLKTPKRSIKRFLYK